MKTFIKLLIINLLNVCIFYQSVHASNKIKIGMVNIDWDPKKLLKGSLNIDKLDANNIEVNNIASGNFISSLIAKYEWMNLEVSGEAKFNGKLFDKPITLNFKGKKSNVSRVALHKGLEVLNS